ncbi:MAG: molecular chaperone TorD family protein, partial [Thiovulaceae bacterium]|nr:molecular chaperone TorD family protein [Sulfurimonadaceae bacterium]
IETGGANPCTDMYGEYNFLVDFEAARVVSADHIGVQLEFMHHLVEAEKRALEEGDMIAVKHFKNAEHEFLNKHLLQWAPHYLISAKYESRTPLYHDVCEMALEFILSDNEYLVAQLDK